VKMTTDFIPRTRKKVSNLLGKEYGRLTVIEYLGKGKWDKHYWKCSCECGGDITLPTYRITGGAPTLSCGCLRKETMLENRADPTKHGLHKHKLYGIYYGIHQRCYNPNNDRYQYYGAKGISVCKEWEESFQNFFDWANKNGYVEGLSIDRLDSSQNYEPSNCEWVTVSENSRRMNANKRKPRAEV
jgi:hypothetical protein